MSYAKIQRDPLNGSAAIPEKLMGVAPPPPLHWRGLTNTYLLCVNKQRTRQARPILAYRFLTSKIHDEEKDTTLHYPAVMHFV